MKTVLVFVPNSLRLNKPGYLEGFYKEDEESEAYYITNEAPVKESNLNIIGYLSDDLNKIKTKEFRSIHINTNSRISLVNYGHCNNPIVRIFYDLRKFRECQNGAHYGEHFNFLCKHLRHRNYKNGHQNMFATVLMSVNLVLTSFINFFDKLKPWGYSATLSHFRDSLSSIKWFFEELIKEGRLTPKTGNFLLSKIIDVALGFTLMQFFIKNEETILRLIETVRETTIHNFRDLLTYLMGSPIGLKLNYSFNNSLGTFFFYHIALWRVFLITMQPFIRDFFKLLVLPGAFGFSFQFAMLSDLISIATFHVYCIYVYAARLLYFQLRGLLSLWRLFIGRKYNPLRERVDSYQYSHHQLFIGTLGFTILLFLLPTTTMYYTVFVIFRLAILIVEEALMRICYLLQCLPVYVLILFIFQSSQLLGPLYLKNRKSKDGIPTFELELKVIPLLSSVRNFVPDISSNTNLSWKKIFTGILV